MRKNSKYHLEALENNGTGKKKLFRIIADKDFIATNGKKVIKNEPGGIVGANVEVNKEDGSWIDTESIVTGRTVINNSCIEDSKIHNCKLKNARVCSSNLSETKASDIGIWFSRAEFCSLDGRDEFTNKNHKMVGTHIYNANTHLNKDMNFGRSYGSFAKNHNKMEDQFAKVNIENDNPANIRELRELAIKHPKSMLFAVVTAIEFEKRYCKSMQGLLKIKEIAKGKLPKRYISQWTIDKCSAHILNKHYANDDYEDICANVKYAELRNTFTTSRR